MQTFALVLAAAFALLSVSYYLLPLPWPGCSSSWTARARASRRSDSPSAAAPSVIWREAEACR